MGVEDFDLEKITEPLQRWFVREGRQLPWRVKLCGQNGEGLEHPDPYRIWVSEIMLQQTRVETVKPYYRRFLERLPDVEALAKCPQEELNKLWEGLGYYSRVRNMKTAAGQVMEEFGGVMPGDYQGLLRLKGIGSYTAGAIASIAYGEPVPAVDGNVLRVLARVTGDDSDIAKPSAKSRMEAALSQLMRAGVSEGKSVPLRPGEAPRGESLDLSRPQPVIFNQALMDLGALVCLPKGKPGCGQCPWQDICVAARRGITDQLPVKSKPNRRRVEERTVLLLRREGRIALRRRPEKGLLAGLYEFPGFSGWLAPEMVLEELKIRGMVPRGIRDLPEARHIFSHVEWRMRGYEIELADVPETSDGDEEGCRELLFIEKAELQERYAVPSAFAAYMKLL